MSQQFHNRNYFLKNSNTRTDWWLDKIKSNSQRDRENFLRLRREDWKVITISECKLKPKTIQKTYKKLLGQLKQNK